jgi:monolysocardiolipin acyltransferase
MHTPITLIPPTNNILWNIGSRIVCAGSVFMSKAVLNVYTRTTTVLNADRFYALVRDEQRTRPIITGWTLVTCHICVVANHVSTLDDPVIWGTTPLHMLLRDPLHRLRWTLGAREICHANPHVSVKD